MIVKRCKICIMPSSKPDLEFNDSGICHGCLAYKNREKIDWNEKREKFIKIIEKYKNKNSHDCIIPVSGGKDSHYQVIKCLEYGLNPYVPATTDKLLEIEDIILKFKIGVDHTDITDPVIRRKINKFTLETIGDISWAEYLTIFTIPVKYHAILKFLY